MIGSAAPLCVLLDDAAITQRVSGLEFRREANGGVQYVKLRLLAPLDRNAVQAFQTIAIQDARNAETVATAQVADLGRSADPSGPSWDIAGFGPAQHASDQELPLIYITQDLSSFRQVNRMQRKMAAGISTKPDNSADTSQDGVLLNAPEGTTLATSDTVTMRFDAVRDAGMFLGKITISVDGGSNDANYSTKLLSSVDGSGGSVHYSATLSNAAVSGNTEVVGTDFTNGRNVFDLYLEYTGAGVTVANDSKWAHWYDLIVRTRLKDKDGTDLIPATYTYANDYVLAHEVVKDLLGRCLPEFDGANAYVDTTATHQIDSLTYPDGVTPGQVLADLLALEPAFRWWVTAAGQFRWEPLPTAVRYEHTLDDGASMPASAQEVYNRCRVRYRDKRGRTRWTSELSLTCPLLDDAGKVRSKMLDAGDEIATSAAATRLGNNFLAEHNVPANAGTITVARPIRDLETGRMVEPHEIEPGELIRVRGVESYPDALNADSNDGQTVFRIWSMTYNSDSHSAALELDTDSRTVANALRRLLTRHNRKR